MKNQQLQQAGLKATIPRLRILRVLEQAQKRHLSAEDVYKALLLEEESSLATVYRVLTQFEQAGLVIRHNFDSDHAVFELAHDEHHDHMVCLDTGEIIEFTDELIERTQEKIAAAHNFELVSHSLVLYVRKKRDAGHHEQSK